MRIKNQDPFLKVLMLKGEKGDKGDKGDPGTTDYNQLENKPTKLSDFENDGVFITNLTDDLVNYYKKSETYTKTEIDNKISAIPKFSIEVVSQLPTEDISDTTVYLVPSQSEPSDIYKEYIYVNNSWELLGIQKVDLSNYYTKSEVDSLLSNKVDSSTLTNNYYNKTSVDSLLSNKVDSSTLTTNYYNKTSVDSLLANKANKVTIETGHPSIILTNRSDGGSATNPTYTTTYRYGYYKRIDNICFITFAIRAEITNAGTGYATLGGLPYTAMDNAGDQALAVQDISGALIDPEDGTSTLKQGVNVAILDYTKQINLNHKNGMMAFKWGVGTVYVCCTGFYFISQ